jgi:integrase/recombinase XerD
MSTAQHRPEILTRFEDYLLASKGLAFTSTELNVGFVRRAIREIGESPAAADIEAYIASLRKRGANYGTVSNAIKAMDHFATFLGTQVQLQRPRKPKHTKVAPLSEAKVAVLLATGCRDLRETAIISTLAYSGIRNSELCRLRTSDVKVDQQALFIEQGKESKDRLAVVSGDCLALLVKYIEVYGRRPDDLLFVTVRNRTQLHQQDLRKIVRTAAARAGVDARVFPHLFRHSLATSMLTRGASPIAVMEQLGHAHLQTTMEYAHAVRGRQRAEYDQFVPSYL